MSRTIKDNPYANIRKPIPRPGHAFGFSKYSKQDRQEEKREIQEQLAEVEETKE